MKSDTEQHWQCFFKTFTHAFELKYHVAQFSFDISGQNIFWADQWFVEKDVHFFFWELW